MSDDKKNESGLPEEIDIFDIDALQAPHNEPGEKEKQFNDEMMREIRREARMKSVREDIERRYNEELEAAKTKADSFDNSVPGFTPAAEVSIDFDEIVTLPKKEDIPAPQAPAAPKDAKPQMSPPLDEDEHGSFYTAVSSLGEMVRRFVKSVFRLVFGIVFMPFKAFYTYFGNELKRSLRKTGKKVFNIFSELGRFRKDAAGVGKDLVRSSGEDSSVTGTVKEKLIRKNSHLLKTAMNFLLPVAAVFVLVITVGHWKGVTFALDVIYDGQHIGYISGESVYVEAKDLLISKMGSGIYDNEDTSVTGAKLTSASAANELKADYKVAIVSLDELSDSEAICDGIIQNSVSDLENACGIYIDGTFMCAVKNEADAKTVFSKILEPFREKADEYNGSASFCEDIDYTQGLYPRSVICSAKELEERLNQTHEAGREYKVSEGDTIASIAEAKGMGEVDIRRMNPGKDLSNLKKGDKILIPVQERYVTVKIVYTRTSREAIKFKTVTQHDATKYSGYRKVKQEGSNGAQKVTTTITLIDGIEVSRDIEKEVIVPSVDEIIVVGSNNYYGNIYVGAQSAKGFLWPAPSCHTISSPFGYRSSGFHKGVDLIKGGGGANGTPVIASRSGKVESISYNTNSYGNMVLINHGDGYKTRYAHMQNGSITVRVGQYVEAGTQLGRVGSTGRSTGPHLHFEVIYNGAVQNPMKYIN